MDEMRQQKRLARLDEFQNFHFCGTILKKKLNFFRIQKWSLEKCKQQLDVPLKTFPSEPFEAIYY